ncbi:MAG TPA: hypothetical protein VGF55_20450 [Gemmataceae bacterium]|jgi:hypothetical protein
MPDSDPLKSLWVWAGIVLCYVSARLLVEATVIWDRPISVALWLCLLPVVGVAFVAVGAWRSQQPNP